MIAAGGGRDLAWSYQRVAAQLLACSGGRAVHLLLHGGAHGADAAIARAQAISSPGHSVSVLVVAFPGGPGTASLVQRQARLMACRSPVPIAVVEVSPSAGRCIDLPAAPAAALP